MPLVSQMNRIYSLFFLKVLFNIIVPARLTFTFSDQNVVWISVWCALSLYKFCVSKFHIDIAHYYIVKTASFGPVSKPRAYFRLTLFKVGIQNFMVSERHMVS